MNILMLLSLCAALAVTILFLARILNRRSLLRGRGVSILIPFRCLDITNQRWENAQWLIRYWKACLPEAEVIMGDDPDTTKPFSKSVSVNNAVRKSKGDILVVVDADGYIDVKSIIYCAAEIRLARKLGHRLWFVPYRQFYRMTREASRRLLNSTPENPAQFGCPLEEDYVLGDTNPAMGHWYGAMIQIMPREAFDIVGGWDERFRGWGGEDHAAMRAMDTLYCLHKTLPGQVLHVWHPQLNTQGAQDLVHWSQRMWENQEHPGANDSLSWRYYQATGRPAMMRALLDEGLGHGASSRRSVALRPNSI